MSQICKEVRFISQLSLDGVVLTRNARVKASEHREECAECMNFHHTLIQATALASDIATEEVFNHADLSSVSRKLKELIDELSDGEDDSVADSASVESRLLALLSSSSSNGVVVPAPDVDEWNCLISDDPGELISRDERDGRIIETYVDKNGWTTTRIRSAGPPSDAIVGPLPASPNLSPDPASMLIVSPPEASQPSDRQRHTLFDITEADIDQIFGRMYRSKSREVSKQDSDRPVPELPVVPPPRVPPRGSAAPVTPPAVQLASPISPPDQKIGFSVSTGALSQFGRISTDKLDDIYDAQGCIKDIGRFLLDPEAVNAFEQIIKSREVNSLVNRLSNDQNTLLERLQTYMHQQHAVIATLVVGRDNLVLNARFRSECFSEDIAQWALCAYLNSKIAVQLLNSKNLYHIILSNEQGDVIISDLGQTFLITVTDKQDPMDREALMAKLETLLELPGS